MGTATIEHVRTVWSWIRRRDLWLMAAAAVLGGLLLVFSEVVDMVDDPGEMPWFDRAVLSGLRADEAGRDPIGPETVERLVADVTALGSGAVTSVLTALVVGFLLVERRVRFALVVVVSVAGAWLGIGLLKQLFGRPRPSMVVAMMDARGMAFPSGHALQSAALYATLAVLLAGAVRSTRAKVYVLGCGVLLPLMVGASRVYLGVHYPTDVLAGWTLGFSWALACGIALRVLQRRRVLEPA